MKCVKRSPLLLPHSPVHPLPRLGVQTEVNAGAGGGGAGISVGDIIGDEFTGGDTGFELPLGHKCVWPVV